VFLNKLFAVICIPIGVWLLVSPGTYVGWAQRRLAATPRVIRPLFGWSASSMYPRALGVGTLIACGYVLGPWP
jgi:hypothetical protein